MGDSKNVCSRYKGKGLTSSGISLLPTPHPPPHRRLFCLSPQLDLLKERLQLVEANSIVNHQRVVNVVTVTLALALKRVFNRQAYDISAEACVFRAGL